MFFLNQNPFIRITVPFIGGIALYMHYATLLPGKLPLLFPIVFTGLLLAFRRLTGYQFRWISGAVIILLMFSAGYAITLIRTGNQRLHTGNLRQDTVGTFLIRLTEPVSERTNSFRIIARSLFVKYDSVWLPAKTGMVVYAEKGDKVAALSYGDILLIHSRMEEVRPPPNPAEFNYKRYLEGRGIHYQGYISSSAWEHTGMSKGNPLKSFGLRFQGRLLDILREKEVAGKEFAIASAILTGYDDELDPETIQAFTSSGAMHILCISGLHVGIIYLILSSLLSFLNRERKLRLLRMIILLHALWFYALITGLSPSVQRAAAMFSFILVGQSLGRKTSSFNSLAASAFVLSLIQPSLIREVGFQLSFLAVAGILFVYPKINALFSPGNWLLRQAWAITSVSMAATLATFPLNLFYFHQFPNLFIITNLIAIPASVVILYSGMLTLITSFIPLIPDICAAVLVYSIMGLRVAVEFIEQIPFSTTTGIRISPTDLALLFATIIGLLVWWAHRKVSGLRYILIPTILLCISFSAAKYRNLTRNELTIYHIRKSTAIDFVSGRNNVFIADSALLSDKKKISYHAGNNWIRCGIRKTTFLDHSANAQNSFFCKQEDHINFKGLLIRLVSGNHLQESSPPAQFVILSKNPRADISALRATDGLEAIVLDASNSYKYTASVEEECDKMGVRCINIQSGEAFVFRLK